MFYMTAAVSSTERNLCSLVNALWMKEEEEEEEKVEAKSP